MNDDVVSSEIILEKRPSKNRVYGFFVMLVAFASSLLLWFYVLGYDSPNYEKEFTVLVEVQGVSELRAKKGFTVISDFGFSIKVVVTGAQTEVNKLRGGDIKAYVDVSQVTFPGNNTLPIHVSVPNENEITVAEKSIEAAVVFIDRNIAAEIPVKIDVADYSIASGYSVGDYIVSPVSVTVEGPESELQKVAYAYGVVRPGRLTASTKFDVSVALFDAGGNKVTGSYILLKDTGVTVNVPVYKTVNIPVRVYFVGGYFSTESARITLSDDYITVKGLVEDFANFTEIQINVAENTLTSETVVKRLTLPPGIECQSGQEFITATIIFDDIVFRTVAASCFAVCDIINAPPDKAITVVTANLNVRFMGPVGALLGLSQSSFRAEIDLSNMNLEPGKTYFVPAVIHLTGDDAGNLNGVFPSGEYGVTISVAAREEP